MPQILHRTPVVLALLVLAVGRPAAAQRVPADTSSSTATSADTLPTVRLDTLTARAFAVPVAAARAPFAVTVVEGEEMRRGRAGLGLDDALGTVPGVQVDNRWTAALDERISIRGFGARSSFGVRGVRVYLDGIPATLPDGQSTLSHVDPAALGRAEVVRGPAGALLGNAAGGAILLRTAEPPPVPLASSYRAVAGEDGLLRLESAVGGRARGWTYRARLSRLSSDGFRAHQESRRTLLGAGASWTGARDQVEVALHAADWDARNPGGLPDSLFRADPSAAWPFSAAQDAGEEGRHGQAGVTWRRGLAGGTMEASAYGLLREIDNPIPPAIVDVERRAGGMRLAWSAAGEAGGGTLRWTLGASADGQRDRRLNFENDAGARGARTLDQGERVRALAAFAQAAWTRGPVEALAALRGDRVRFAVDDRMPVSADDPDDSGARTLAAWSPSAGLSVAVADGVRLFAGVATAFETPTTAELANRPDGAGGFNPALEPQRTLSWEAGARGRLDALPLRWEAAAYRARVRDALVPFEVPSAPGRQFHRNAGSAVHRGVEAALAAGPVRGVEARLAYAWTDARFDDHVVDGVDLGGERVPGVAPHRLAGALSWTSERGPFAALDARRVSAVPADDANTAEAEPYTLLDLRTGWEGVPVGRLRLSPFAGVSNLLDERYAASVVVNAFGGRFFEPGPPRSAYVGVRAEMR